MKTLKTLLAAATVAVCGLIGTGVAHAQTPGKTAKTAKTTKTSKASNAKKAAALADEGMELKAQGELDDALEKFVAAIELDPTNMTALLGAAWIFNDQQDYDNAVLVATAAVKVDAKNGNAWRELGYASWKLDNTKEAKDYLMAALVCDQTDMVACGYLIEVLDELGDTKTANELRKLKEEAEGGKPAKKTAKKKK